MQSHAVEAVQRSLDDRFLLHVDHKGQRLLDWANDHRDMLNDRIRDDGAVFLRGLNILSSRQFGQLLAVVFGHDLLDYSFRSTPRTELRGRIYTATEYHPGEVIPQHNENSYTNSWATRIGFYCLLPSASGGETPIADSRDVYNAIDASVRDAFEEHGVMYVRNYGDIDLPWKEVFQTEERSDVERYCTDNGIEFEWMGENDLRTRQVRPASVSHPDHDFRIWFNQAHLFHLSNMRKEYQESLLAMTDEAGLPRNTYFGDGAPIPVDMLDHIREVYFSHEQIMPWQAKDVMLLDNMWFSHGRKPFTGERKVLVGMAKPMIE